MGQASDIESFGYSGQQLANIARKHGFNGIGIASDWCHVDIREVPAEWTY